MLTESTYLLDFSRRAQQALLSFVAKGAVDVAEFGASDVRKARHLMEKHGDLPMDFADATLVERVGTSSVFTLDRRISACTELGEDDFESYRDGGAVKAQ